MNVFRDPTLTLTTVLVAGLLAVTGIAFSVGSPSAHAGAADTVDVDDVAALRSHIPHLLRPGAAGNPALAGVADDVAELAGDAAERLEDTDPDHAALPAWKATADDAAALSDAASAPRRVTDALRSRLLSDISAVTTAHATGVAVTPGAGTLQPYDLHLDPTDRDLPDHPSVSLPDAPPPPAGHPQTLPRLVVPRHAVPALPDLTTIPTVDPTDTASATPSPAAPQEQP